MNIEGFLSIGGKGSARKLVETSVGLSGGRITLFKPTPITDFYDFSPDPNPVREVESDRRVYRWQAGLPSPSLFLVGLNVKTTATLAFTVDGDIRRIRLAELAACKIVTLRFPGGVDLDLRFLRQVTRRTRRFRQNLYKTSLHTHSHFSDSGVEMKTAAETMFPDVDVVWWVDHDLGFHSKIENGGFEERACTFFEVMCGDEMVEREMRVVKGKAAHGRHSLYARARHTGPLFREIRNRGWLLDRAMEAGPRVQATVFPVDEPGQDGVIFIEALLGRPDYFGPYRFIRYALTKATDLPANWIRVPFKLGQWNRFAFDVLADCRRLYGFIDTNLFGVKLGLASRNGREVKAYFDDVQCPFRLSHYDLYRKQLATTRRYERGFVSRVGIELSLATMRPGSWITPHINLYYDPARMKDTYLINGKDTDARKQHSIEAVHREGGIAQIHHHGAFFDKIRKARGWNCDLMELQYDWGYIDPDPWKSIGRRQARKKGYDPSSPWSLYVYLAFWDEMTEKGIYLTGESSMDLHERADFPMRFDKLNKGLTWIYAHSTSYPDLIHALRTGRCFFGWYEEDLALDILTPEGFCMGDIVLTDRGQHAVRLVARGAAPGDTLAILENGVLRKRISIRGDRDKFDWTVSTRKNTYFRFELYNAVGFPRACSNWIVFLRRPPHSWPVGRAAASWQGGYVRAGDSFSLDAITPLRGGKLRLEGHLLGARGNLLLGSDLQVVPIRGGGRRQGRLSQRHEHIVIHGSAGEQMILIVRKT